MHYESTRTIESAACEGVTFRIAKMSFARRLELVKRVRELGRHVEFQQAGQRVEDKMDAAISTAEIDKVYLQWGLVAVEGLQIDGEAADVGRTVEAGPEALCREIVGEIRRECGLDADEIKN